MPWSPLRPTAEGCVDGPSADPEDLPELAGPWKELHRHHREVSEYGPLVSDLDEGGARRFYDVAGYRPAELVLYRRLSV